ncbi:MAG TPA: LamG-like jellyroll fold domain-containing protein [Candidatus Acidoferrum sp.]|nr:LamG-like jellyroll fold domain-containing protein [Candidatus Acidoferrum sp.]
MKKSSRCLFGRLLLTAGATLMTVAPAIASYQSTVQADNPIAYFALDSLSAGGSGTASDLSGNGNNAPYVNVYPITGPTAYVPNAGQFDPGSSSSVNLPSSGILNYSNTITMEAWVQPLVPSQSLGDIVAKGFDSASNIEDVLRLNQNQYQGGSYNNGTSKMANGGSVTTNWTYVVTTFDGTNWNTYVNSILVARTADTAGAIYSPDSWAIGNGTVDGNGRYFNGNICQVALYTNALTPAQIVNHYVVAELNTTAAGAVPVIATQPQSQGSYVGGTVTFSVVAASATSTTNLWFKNSTPLPSQTNSALILTNLALGDAGNYSVVVGNVNGTTNSVVASLTVATPRNLKWTGSGGATWDTGTTASWLNLANSATTVFDFGDAVLFDDTPGVPTTITFSGLVTPSTMTVNSSVNNYSFGPYSPGNNTISGPVKLIKQGTSTLTLGTAGQFTGPVDVEGGEILAQGYSFQSVPSITIASNAMVDLSGGQYSNPGQYIYMSGSGINGQGALFNSLYGVSFIFNIVLTGDAKMGCIGGTSGIGLTGGSISGPHVLTLDWQNVNGYNEWDGPITIGADVVGISLTNGTLGMKYMTTACQNPNTLFTAGTNTTFAWWNGTGGFDGSIHMQSNSIARLWSAGTIYSGSTITLDGPMDWSTWGDPGDITIDSSVVLNGIVHVIIGDHNIVYTNVISGSGGYVMDFWNHAMILSAVNTYTGPTVINDGLTLDLTGNGSISHSSLIFFGGSNAGSTHLDVSGRTDQTLTLASGQTLAGIGAVNGGLVVAPGATISPAGTNITIGITAGTNSVGTLAAANNVTLNGTTVIKLDGSGSNDLIQAAANITYGGTLNLVNISGLPLAAGNSFQVFSAASYTGSFTSITPATPGPGLAWNTTQLNAGLITVTAAPSQPVISSTKLLGGNLIFGGTNGTALGGYSVLTTTNITTPLANWTLSSTGSFDGSGAFSVTNTISSGSAKRFYMIRTP